MSDDGWVAPGAPQQPHAGPPQQPQPWPPQQHPHPPPQPPAWPPRPPAQPIQPPPHATLPIGLETRPGVIPLRPLGLGDIYTAAFKTIRVNPGATFGLATLTVLVCLVPMTALGAWFAATWPTLETDSGETVPVGLLGQYGPVIAQWISTVLLTGFVAYVVGQAVLGRKVRPEETWRATARRVGWLLLATVVVALIMLIGLLVAALVLVLIGLLGGGILFSGSDPSGFGIVVAVLGVVVLAVIFAVVALMISTPFAFVTPPIVLERLGALAAIGRSVRLVGSPFAKPFWRIVGIRLLTTLMVGVVAGTLSFAFTFGSLLLVVQNVAPDPESGAYLAWNVVISALSVLLTGALTTPFVAAVDALLYVDARIRREALDVHLMQSAQGIAPPPWAPAQR